MGRMSDESSVFTYDELDINNVVIDGVHRVKA